MNLLTIKQIFQQPISGGTILYVLQHPVISNIMIWKVYKDCIKKLSGLKEPVLKDEEDSNKLAEKMVKGLN